MPHATFNSRLFPFPLLLSVFVLAMLAGLPARSAADSIRLPEPDTRGAVSLAEAIHRRQSVRRYAERPLGTDDLGQLLWAAAGLTVDGTSGPTRAPASAGGLYPIEAFAVVGVVDGVEAGVYRYDPRGHELALVRKGDVRDRLRRSALGQAPVAAAPAVVVLGADYAVTERRYGERGVERYVHMDSGHAAQNVLLQAQALGLGAVPIGAFRGDRVRDLLELPTEPLYLIPVGHPR
jgi:SagB-type dehydrogenase family enzyme